MTPDDLAGQMARLEDAWGAPKDRSPQQFVGMAREWFGQLERFGIRTVESAFTSVIGSHKFQWAGAIVEIVALCAKDHSEWRDALGLHDNKRFVAEPLTFARDGRTDAEEIEFRAQQVAAMKRDAGFNSASEPGTAVPRDDVKPASQFMGVSDHVRNSCAARRARNEKTCELSCSRQSCALREGEAMANAAANQAQRSHTGAGDFDDTRHGQS